MTIRVGDFVEISSKEDGFLGSYFVARVVAAKPAKDNFTVEYENLLSDEDENKKLREVVRAADLRPCPPLIRVSGFDVLEVVDAYDGDGWWVGRVTGRVGADRYSVYFDSTGDEFVYSGCVLRVHQEWEDGIWVPSHT
ncbi:hypothetical protein ACOSP7_030991 [Xanthoceras sorbifolium]|uniref:Agenet domain-containing protein n=1 Tax=Xanthoceras sorbifolium TaxID=99658 RepID=A0ABQ8H1G3_9ROSI|nr:hypothetical protein JRO89_XS15G0088600 [Xanthoceras sorbifolium]